MKATINNETVGHPTCLADIECLYPRLSKDGDSIVITDDQDNEIERHIMIEGTIVPQECCVDYDPE